MEIQSASQTICAVEDLPAFCSTSSSGEALVLEVLAFLVGGSDESTEGDTQSPEQALTLLSETGPDFVSRALSEGALAFRTLRVSLRMRLPKSMNIVL